MGQAACVSATMAMVATAVWIRAAKNKGGPHTVPGERAFAEARTEAHKTSMLRNVQQLVTVRRPAALHAGNGTELRAHASRGEERPSTRRVAARIHNVAASLMHAL